MLSFPNRKADYSILNIIGRGVTSTVYVAQCKTNNKTVAIKTIDLETCQIEIDTLLSEVEFWASVKSPNIVDYYCSFIDGPILYIVMEYMSAGSCYDLMRYDKDNNTFNESVITIILYNVTKALAHFHSKRAIHRDIKPGNILINQQGEVKIGDFGIAANLVENGKRRKARYTVVGTPFYMAPEVLKEECGYTEKADIWSLGITAYELALGQNPYAGLDSLRIIMNITTKPPPVIPESSKFSPAFKDFVKSCLNADPKKRPNAEVLLNHKLFKQIDKQNATIKDFVANLPSLSERYIKSTKTIRQEVIAQPEKEKFKFDFFDESESESLEKMKEPEMKVIKSNDSSDNELTPKKGVTRSISLPENEEAGTKKIGKFKITTSPMHNEEDEKIEKMTAEVARLTEYANKLRSRNELLETQVVSLEQQVQKIKGI